MAKTVKVKKHHLDLKFTSLSADILQETTPEGFRDFLIGIHATPEQLYMVDALAGMTHDELHNLIQTLNLINPEDLSPTDDVNYKMLKIMAIILVMDNRGDK